MSDIEIWKQVNSCETVEELEIVLKANFGDLIQGRTRQWSRDQQIKYIRQVVNDEIDPSFLTRNYGIRQQAIYIKLHGKS